MDLAVCSKKVSERALKPQFVGTETECDEYLTKSDHFFCHFHFPNSNGEISIYGQLAHEGNNHVIKEAKFFTNVQGAPLAFLDALVELSHKRDAHSLPLLRLKEIEAFLRDKNSEPSLPDDGIHFLRYYEVVHGLTHSISKNKTKAFGEADLDNLKSPSIDEYQPHSTMLFDKDKTGPFADLDLDSKINTINDVLSYHVRPLLQRDGGDVECIHVMENLIVVLFHGNCGTCGMSLTTTMDFIKKVLRTELYDPTLDIISDS